MPAPFPPEPRWLAAWRTDGLHPQAALDRFDALPGVEPDRLAGRWNGRGLPTGHPLDGLLEGLGWSGKEVLPGGQVHPLVFRRPSGSTVRLEPAWMPTGIALHWPTLAKSMATKLAFHALVPLLRARNPGGRIEMRDVRGRRAAAIVYARQPIVDHLRQIDPDRLLGLMDRRGMATPYYFLLTRNA